MVKVVKGSVTTNALNYKLAGSQTIAKGDLVRITSAGTIKIAGADTDVVGAVHGIALKNGAATGTTSAETKVAGDLFPVALLNQDTVLAIPLPADKSWATVSTLTTKGLVAPITATTQAQRLADSVTKGIMMVVGLPSDDDPNPNIGDSVLGGDVYVTVLNSVLQGRSA